MRVILIPALSLLAASCVTVTPSEETPPGPELAAELQGRVAGPPQACVSQRDLTSNRTVDNGAAIIFGTRGDTIYVNRPAGGCPSLQFGRTLVTKTTTDSLCRGDIARVVDLQAGFDQGSCGLGDFVPYRKVKN